MYQVKRGYYHNAKKQTYNNQKYDSKLEVGYAQELDLRLKAKDIKGWEAQKQLDLIVNEYIVCNYRIDFVVYHNDGITEYVEMKGVPTALWSLKWKLFEALYSELPNTKLTVIYQGAGRRKPKPRKIKTIKNI